MDPKNLGGGDLRSPQTGGFLDPGLSALVAALLSGGIGFYGYSKTTDADKKAAADAAIKGLGAQFEQKARENEAALNEFKKNQATAESNAARVKTLTAEVARLKSQLSQSSGDSALFAGASSDNLLAAVQPTLDGLKQAGLVTAGNEAAVKKALEYAARPEIRLLRMSLPTFYAKQIAPALAMKGGRRRHRRQRGGINDASDTPRNALLNEYAVLFDKLTSKSGTDKERDRLDELRAKLNGFEEGRQEIARLDAQEADKLAKEAGPPAAETTTPPPAAEATVPPPAAEATVPPPAAEATVPPPAAETTTPPPAAETGDKTYDLFVKVYTKAISDAKAGQIKRIQESEAAASEKRKTAADTKATKKANKAAKTLAENYATRIGDAYSDSHENIKSYVQLHKTLDLSRIEKVKPRLQRLWSLYTLAKTFVSEDDYKKLTEKDLEDEDDEDVTRGVSSLLDLFTGRGGAWPFSKSTPDDTPIDTTPFPSYKEIVKDENSDAKLKPVKERLAKLPDQIQKATKDYIQAVKDAEKEETKELTDIGKRNFFRVTVPASPGNVFSSLAKKLTDPSTSYTEAQVADIVRDETKRQVLFIKNVVAGIDKILQELENLRKKEVLDAKKKKGGRRRRARGGKTPEELAAERMARAEGSSERFGTTMDNADDTCAEIREDEKYKAGDPKYLYDNIKAIVYGSDTKMNGIKWVSKLPTAPEEKSSLKFLLNRLNTGRFAPVADYFKGVRGKEVTYTPDDIILAGEAFILLKCFQKRAVEKLKGFIKSDTVLAKRGRESQIRAEDSAKANAVMKEIEDADTAFKAAEDKLRPLVTDVPFLIGLNTRELDFEKAFMNQGVEPAWAQGKDAKSVKDTKFKLFMAWEEASKMLTELSSLRTKEPAYKAFIEAEKLSGKPADEVEAAFRPLAAEYASKVGSVVARANAMASDTAKKLYDAARDFDAQRLSSLLNKVRPYLPPGTAGTDKTATSASVAAAATSRGTPVNKKPAEIELTPLPTKPPDAALPPGADAFTEEEASEEEASEEERLKDAEMGKGSHIPEEVYAQLTAEGKKKWNKPLPGTKVAVKYLDNFYDYDPDTSYLAVRNPNNWLTWAVVNSKQDQVEAAIRAGADVNATSDTGVLRKGTDDKVFRERFLREPPSRFTDPPVFLVKTADILKTLASSGQALNVNVKDLDDYTPLHIAINTKRAEVANSLIELGADVMALDVDKRTPLHLGALPGVTEKILEKDPNALEARDKFDRTPLWRLIEQGDIDSVRLLLDKGANTKLRGTIVMPDGTEKEGSLVDLVKAKGTPEIKALFKERGLLPDVFEIEEGKGPVPGEGTLGTAPLPAVAAPVRPPAGDIPIACKDIKGRPIHIGDRVSLNEMGEGTIVAYEPFETSRLTPRPNERGYYNYGICHVRVKWDKGIESVLDPSNLTIVKAPNDPAFTQAQLPSAGPGEGLEMASLNQPQGLKRTPSKMYQRNPLINEQKSKGDVETSPFEKAKAWVKNVWNTATADKKKDLATTGTYKKVKSTLEDVAQRGATSGEAMTGGGPEEDAAEANRLLEELKQFGGRRSRKRTLKKRRGGKQNGRRTRRGKNRANRSHSHAR